MVFNTSFAWYIELGKRLLRYENIIAFSYFQVNTQLTRETWMTWRHVELKNIKI